MSISRSRRAVGLSGWLIGAAAMLSLAAGANASVVDPGPFSLDADADSFIHGGTSQLDNNYGGWTHHHVKTNSGNTRGFSRKAYYRFDISELEAAVEQASLTLSVAGAGGDSLPDKVWTFNVYGLTSGDDDWNETDPDGINWNNAPGNEFDTGNGVIEEETAFVGSFDILETGTVGDQGVVSGQLLADFLNQTSGNGLATFILVRETREASGSGGDDDVWHWFGSRTNNDESLRPDLTVTLVPEPGTLGMLAVGLLAAMRRRSGDR